MIERCCKFTVPTSSLEAPLSDEGNSYITAICPNVEKCGKFAFCEKGYELNHAVPTNTFEPLQCCCMQVSSPTPSYQA